MKLTTRNTESLVRCVCSASKPELEQCARELKGMAADFEQPASARAVAKEIGTLVRKQIRKF